VLEAIDRLRTAPGVDPNMPLRLWVRIVYEFALNYIKGEGDPDKVAESLLPLYYARAATYLRAVQGQAPAARESLVRDTVQVFAQSRASFAQQWNGYAAWLDTPDYWFS
jgi:hypothetical protein